MRGVIAMLGLPVGALMNTRVLWAAVGLGIMAAAIWIAPANAG
jgi:hypothetical protein